MKKLAISLFPILAVIFAVASAFNSTPKNVDDLKYTVYGIDFESVPAIALPYEMTPVTEPLTAEEWVATYQEFFLANKVADHDTDPIDVDYLRAIYCDETFNTYICLIQVERNEFDVPVLVAKDSYDGITDYACGDFSQP